MCQRKQAQMQKYAFRENTTWIDYDYRLGYQVMIRYKASFKYETPLKLAYDIVQTWTNITVTLWMGLVIVRINILNIKTL